MTDWRKVEDVIVHYFEREGPGRPSLRIGQKDPLSGEWVLPYGKGVINLSALAREIINECR